MKNTVCFNSFGQSNLVRFNCQTVMWLGPEPDITYSYLVRKFSLSTRYLDLIVKIHWFWFIQIQFILNVVIWMPVVLLYSNIFFPICVLAQLYRIDSKVSKMLLLFFKFCFYPIRISDPPPTTHDTIIQQYCHSSIIDFIKNKRRLSRNCCSVIKWLVHISHECWLYGLQTNSNLVVGSAIRRYLITNRRWCVGTDNFVLNR